MDPAVVNTVPLLDALPTSRRGVAHLADELEVPAGTHVTKQGEYAGAFFVILDGTAEVVKDGERVATLGPGDFFGEIGLFSSISRVAAVIALSPMRLLMVAPQEFERRPSQGSAPASAGSSTATVRAPSPRRRRSSASSMPSRSVTCETVEATSSRPSAMRPARSAISRAGYPEP
jgi:cyclic nucleotide-binding protein